MCAARLKAHEPQDGRRGCAVYARQTDIRMRESLEKRRETRVCPSPRGEYVVHLRTETTRSSSSMENACVIAIDPGG